MLKCPVLKFSNFKSFKVSPHYPVFPVSFIISSSQLFKVSGLFSTFYNHFCSNPQILRTLHSLLQSSLFESSNSPDVSVSFTIISFQLFIFLDFPISFTIILQTFQYLLQSFLFKVSNSPDFPIYVTIISCRFFKFSGLFSIFCNHFFSTREILRTFQSLSLSFPFKSLNSLDFSVSFTILSSPISKFSGLFSTFYNNFFSNLPILCTFQYLLQAFLFKASSSPHFPISFTVIPFLFFKFSGLFRMSYNHFFSNLQILRTFQYLAQSFPFKSSNSRDFSIAFTTPSSPIFKFFGLFSLFYNNFCSKLQIRRTFQYLL